MKALVSFIISVCCVLSVQQVSGQGFINKLGKKIKEKIETPDTGKVTPADTAGQPAEQPDAGNFLKKIGFSNETVPIEEAYTFDMAVHMLTENYRKGKIESNQSFIYYLDQQGKNVAFEPVENSGKEKMQGRFIIDLKNNAMIMLSEEDGKKLALVFGHKLNEPVDQEDRENTGTFRKTGRSKTIQGYSCDEYAYEDNKEKAESFFWITPEVDLPAYGLGGNPTKRKAFEKNMPAGFVMAYEWISKQNDDKTVMTVTNIEKNLSKQISMNQYEVQHIGTFMTPKQ